MEMVKPLKMLISLHYECTFDIPTVVYSISACLVHFLESRCCCLIVHGTHVPHSSLWFLYSCRRLYELKKKLVTFSEYFTSRSA